MMKSPVTPPPPRSLLSALSIALTLFSAAAAHAAGVFYVDNSSGNCSDAGPGTEAAPYCTISAAVLAHHGPGITIYVKPGTYREEVDIPLAGTAGSPLVLQAINGPVIIEGADDFSSTGAWTQYSGDTYLAAGVTWQPNQAFLDGARLNPSQADPAFLPVNSFEWVSGQGLYVNASGGNPGAHQLLVGRRPYGFLAPARNYLTLDGFTVFHSENRGVQLNNACTNVTLTHIHVAFCYRYGIQAVGGSNDLFDSNVVTDNGDHGIMLLNGVTASTIQNNESARNAQPAAHAANGIHLFGSSGNLIQYNRTHENQDSGIQLDGGSNDCVVRGNRSWNNSDHGIDNINASGTYIISNDAFGNISDGYSIDGSSTNVTIENCIGTDNGLLSKQWDLMVSATPAATLHSDYNVFWNSISQPPVRFVTTQYATIGAYTAATGQDAHTAQVDPAFVNPWAGDFRLTSGSVAIDNADSAVPSWPDTDATGQVRVDDLAVSDFGVGPITYGDRGALEFPGGTLLRPFANLVVTPSTGQEPLVTTVDASGSYDLDGTIAYYQINFGDGTSVGPTTNPTWQHTYAAGDWIVSVVVTDNQGAAQGTSVIEAVTSGTPPNLALNPSFEQNIDGWNPFGAALLEQVPGGHDGAYALQMTGTATNHAVFGTNDHNDWVRSVVAPGALYRYGAWVRSPGSVGQAELSVNEYVLTTGEPVGSGASTRVTLTPDWQFITLDYVAVRQGTTLDFQVRDYPVAIGETFMVDDIAIHNLGLTTTSVGGPSPAATLAPVLFPSPLHNAGTLRFATSRPGRLSVEILDLSGRRVRQLADEAQAAPGMHEFAVSRSGGHDGPALGPGIYFYRVAGVDGVKSGRFAVLR
jgi:hypothetical protein